MENPISIRQYLENFDKGMYDYPDVKTQIDAGWYDWFCNDTSLQKKTVELTKKLKKIVNSKKIDQDSQYVWFKNNCPLQGKLYDDFRIADIETGESIWCIIPKSGHDSENGKGIVFSVKEGHIVFTGSWKDIVNWFNKD